MDDDNKKGVTEPSASCGGSMAYSGRVSRLVEVCDLGQRPGDGEHVFWDGTGKCLSAADLRTIADVLDARNFNEATACIRRLSEENDRLRLAIARIAKEDATLSVCDGNVTVTMDAVVSDSERDAVEFMLRHAAVTADAGAFHDSGDYRKHHDVLFDRVK